jgi:hypothetical protein
VIQVGMEALVGRRVEVTQNDADPYEADVVVVSMDKEGGMVFWVEEDDGEVWFVEPDEIRFVSDDEDEPDPNY